MPTPMTAAQDASMGLVGAMEEGLELGPRLVAVPGVRQLEDPLELAETVLAFQVKYLQSALS